MVRALVLSRISSWFRLTLFDKDPRQSCDDGSTETEPNINKGTSIGLTGFLSTKIDNQES